MGAIKDSINKGFTVGEVTTSTYDETAKIKIKDFYSLDKLERKKLIELAEKIDTELIIRDNKLKEIEDKIEDIGTGTNESNGNNNNRLNTYELRNESGKIWCIFSDVIPKSAMEKLDIITLDKYNSLVNNKKYEVDYSLGKMGIKTPITVEKIEGFLKGNPTGVQTSDIAYIYEWFVEGYEINKLNLDVEYYNTSSGEIYNFIHSEVAKLFIPKLLFYKDFSNNTIAVNEKNIMGRWEKMRGLDKPSYFGQMYPFYVGYKILENGDYEVYIYTEYRGGKQILRSNKEVFLVTRADIIAQNRNSVNPFPDFSKVGVSYNSSSPSGIPYNLSHFIGDIPISSFKHLSVRNEVTTQVSQVSVEFGLTENITLTADNKKDLKVVLFQNLNWDWAADKFSNMEILLKPTSYSVIPENIKSIPIVVNKNSISFTLEKGTSFTFSSDSNISYTAKVQTITAFD